MIMREYAITVSFVVDARDHDEAVEIAKAVRSAVEQESGYVVRDVETQRIEEL